MANTIYEQAFAQYLRNQENLKEKHEPEGYWYPSQIGGCDRASLLQHIGADETPTDDESLRNFWMGNRIHEALQDTFPFEILGSEKSAKIKDEVYHVSGRLDLLARVDGVVEATEFKSIKDEKFKYGLPDEHHILQLGCYLTFTVYCFHGRDKEPWEDVCQHEDKTSPLVLPQPEQGRLVYWGKGNAKILEVVVRPTATLAETIKGEFVRLENIYQKNLADKSIPKPIPLTDWRIRGPKKYCRYAGTGQCCGDS